MVYPGAYRVGDTPNKSPRLRDVSQIILHHTASTGDVEDIWNMFTQSNSRQVSANYLVAQDGRVFEVMNPDNYRAWTSGSGPNGSISPDHSAITFEVMDETGAPTWTTSPAAQEAVAQVMAWASQRYQFPLIRQTTVRGHRELPGQSTACPGGMPMDSITARANAIIASGGSNEESELMSAKDDILSGVSKMLNENVTHTNIVRNEKTGAIAAVNYAAGFWFDATAPRDIDTWVALNIVPVGEPVQNLDDGSFRYARGVANAQLSRLHGKD